MSSPLVVPVCTCAPGRAAAGFWRGAASVRRCGAASCGRERAGQDKLASASSCQPPVRNGLAAALATHRSLVLHALRKPFMLSTKLTDSAGEISRSARSSRPHTGSRLNVNLRAACSSAGAFNSSIARKLDMSDEAQRRSNITRLSAAWAPEAAAWSTWPTTRCCSARWC